MSKIQHCITCNTCFDIDGNKYSINLNIFHTSGLCPICFAKAVRTSQLQRTGSFCYGTEIICPKPACKYQEKCDIAKQNFMDG